MQTGSVFVVCAVALCAPVRAQEQVPPALSVPPGVELHGLVEAYAAHNFRTPDNGLNDFRGFDNRNDALTLSNVVVQAAWDVENVVGLIALQVGATPATYTLAEPALAGSSGANGTGAALWRFVQQAQAGYRFDVLRELVVSGGVFLSPIGPEAMNVKDNWAWSRSNAFFGLPFYHAGARATLAVDASVSLSLGVFNGWNNIVDNNVHKSLSASVLFSRGDTLTAQALYFGGVERGPGAPEGAAWRHLLDVHATWRVLDRLWLQGHANAGVEPNTFGVSHWAAGAVAVRVRVLSPLFVAARVDGFREHAANNARGQAGRIFFPADRIGSATGTLELRPNEHVSLRLEARHDHADSAMYFAGAVQGNGVTAPYVENAAVQDTVTLGATAWF